jgi:hypothetical protein
MAQAPRESGGGAAEFVRNVVSDPKNVPDVMLLRGYPGASSEEAHERLYLSADLSSYVEIPRAAILHQAALPKEQDAHGGVTVWVRKDAALQYKMAPAAQAMANYFAGAIQAGAQGAAVGHGVAGAIQPTPTAIPTHYLICQPTRFQPQCPYPSEVCTHVGACPTRHPGYCPLPEAAARAGGAAQQAAFAGQANLRASPNVIDCSIVCPTRIGPCLSHHVSCAPCVTQHPLQCSIACPTRLEFSCNIACQVTNFAECPVASGAACPQVSIACPVQSAACGGGDPAQQGGPIMQALALDARVGALQATIDISYAPGCWYSYNACPSMLCHPFGTHNTPCCPW